MNNNGRDYRSTDDFLTRNRGVYLLTCEIQGFPGRRRHNRDPKCLYVILGSRDNGLWMDMVNT